MIPRIHIHERHVLMWLLGVTIATIAAGALWLAVDQRASHKNDNTPTTHLRWMHSGQYSIIADYFDPSVMSLPDARGFSGKAWQYVSLPTPSAYEPDRTTAFLASPANAALPVLLAEKPISELIQAGVEWTMVEPTNSVSIILPVTNSVLEVTGTLCDRGILQQPVLPLAPTGTPVRGARVLVAVTGDGRVQAHDERADHENVMAVNPPHRSLQVAPLEQVEFLAHLGKAGGAGGFKPDEHALATSTNGKVQQFLIVGHINSDLAYPVFAKVGLDHRAKQILGPGNMRCGDTDEVVIHHQNPFFADGLEFLDHTCDGSVTIPSAVEGRNAAKTAT